MAGKKKGGKGKEKKAKPVVDGVEIKQMSKPQLYGHCKRLQDEIRREIDDRNRFMLERERYYLLWQLIIERVDVQKDKLDIMKSHMEDTLKEKDKQDAAYEQKLRFLKSEQSKKLGEVRLFHLERMKMVQDDAWNLQVLMRDALLCKKSAIRKAQMSLFEIMRALHLKHGKDLSTMRKKFYEEIRILDASFNRRLFAMNDNEEQVQDEVLSQIVTIKEDQLRAMFTDHEMKMKDMKMFFNELTVNNLTLISKMELELKLSKENEIRLSREEASLSQTLNSVAGPINKTNDTMKEWEVIDDGLKAEEMERDLKTLLHSKARLKRQAKMTEYSNEALLQRIGIAEKERDELRKSFAHAIVDMQRKTCMKKLVTALQRKAATREAEIFNAISSNLDDPTGEFDHYQLILGKRDEKLSDVLQLVTEAATDYKTTYDIYTGAYQNNVIPLDEIGFPIIKSGAKPRNEDDRPEMIFDIKGNKRNRVHAHQQTNAITEGLLEGGSGEASKSSMSSGHNASDNPKSVYGANRARSVARTKSHITDTNSMRTKSAKSIHSHKGKVVPSSIHRHSHPVRKSLENMTEKFTEHIRHRQQKETHEREIHNEEKGQPQQHIPLDLQKKDSQLVILKGPPGFDYT